MARRARPRSCIWRATTSRLVWSSRLSAGRAHDEGRHQVLEHRADHEMRAEPRPTGVSARPSRNQWSGVDVALGDREEAGEPGLGREQVVVARVERRRRGPGTRSRTACGSGRTGSRSPSPGTAAGPGRRSPARRRTSCAAAGAPASGCGRSGGSDSSASVGKAVACGSGSASSAEVSDVAARRPAEPPRPTSRARCSAPSPRSAVMRRGDVRQRPGVRRELAQARRPVPRASRGRRRRLRPAARGPRRGARRVSVWRSPVVADVAGGLARQRDRVADPGERGRDRERLVDHLAAGVGQRQQVAGEIAAVDRRHVRRARAGAGRACRTSCRGARGSARGARSSRASPRGAPPSRSVPIQPKSRAVTVASRYIPMFVGEVRWATTGVGSSWKLSGGSALSSGPTNVSKNSHVRRAVRRSVSTSAAESCSAADSGGGRLTQRATSGDEQPERRRTARRARPRLGFTARTRAAVATAIATPPAIWR